MTKYKKLLIFSTIFVTLSTLVFLCKDIFIRSLIAPLFHVNMEIIYRIASGTFVDYMIHQVTVIAIIIVISVILFSIFYFTSTFLLYKKSKLIDLKVFKYMNYFYIAMFIIPIVCLVYILVTTLIATSTIQTELQLMQQSQPVELIMQELLQQLKTVSFDNMNSIWTVVEHMIDYIIDNSHLVKLLETGFNHYRLVTSLNTLYNFIYPSLLAGLWCLNGYSWMKVYQESKEASLA